MICHCLDADNVILVMALGLAAVIFVLMWFNTPRR